MIICNSSLLCQAASPKSVIVVPCTASARGPLADWHVEIPETEPAFSKDRVVALANLIQPILKSDLIECVGVLTAGTFVRIQTVVAGNLGLLSARSNVVEDAVKMLGSPSKATSQP
ncbi:hypothetical protein AnaeK_1416 [Anaeromyxobacter sp. K]|nr:hypothetical protein AnaeK_1416 [Anaeromyxobacter sp. K]